MTDFHQRFREKFDGCLHFVAEEHFPDILAFIDEVTKAEYERGYYEGEKNEFHNLAGNMHQAYKDGRTEERAALIEKMEGMTRCYVRYDEDKGYNQALDDILSFLREKPIGSDGTSEDTCRETPEAIGTPREPTHYNLKSTERVTLHLKSGDTVIVEGPSGSGGSGRNPEKALPRKGNGYDCGEEGCCRPVEGASQGCCEKCWTRIYGSLDRCSDKNCPCHSLQGDNDGTENCYLEYDDAPGVLICSYNHKEGEKCLMTERFEREYGPQGDNQTMI